MKTDRQTDREHAGEIVEKDRSRDGVGVGFEGGGGRGGGVSLETDSHTSGGNQRQGSRQIKGRDAHTYKQTGT